MKVYPILVAAALACGVTAAEAQTAGSRLTRNVCEIVHSVADVEELARKLPAALEKCGNNAWVSLHLWKLTAADVAGILCRPDSPVVVDQGRLGCMAVPATINRQVIRLE